LQCCFLLLFVCWIWVRFEFCVRLLLWFAWYVLGECCDGGDSDVALLTGSAFASKIFRWICARTLNGGFENKCLEGFVFCHLLAFYSLRLLLLVNSSTSSMNRFIVYFLWCIIFTYTFYTLYGRALLHFFLFSDLYQPRLTIFVKCLCEFSIYIKLSVCSEFLFFNFFFQLFKAVKTYCIVRLIGRYGARCLDNIGFVLVWNLFFSS